jgi:hypothetical protein
VRAAAAPGGKRLVGIGVIDVTRIGEAFQYLADLGTEDGAAGRLAVAPVAWEPCSPDAVCGVEQRLLYMAPVPNAGAASAGPLALFGLGRPPSATPGGLFASTVSSPALLTGDAPRLGMATGMVGLAWRSAVSGVEGASLIGMARDTGKPVALRTIDSVSGHAQDVGVQLAPDIGAGASSISVRWDVPHSRALVMARQSDRASGAEAIDAWLVDFGPAAGQER